MSREYKHWNKERKLIPKMVNMYCRGNHRSERKKDGVKGKQCCSQCRELTDYALYRLDKCPFKKDKGFCSFCSIHCYKPEYRTQMKAVMKYSGVRMLFTHPIFVLSHVVMMIKEKKKGNG